MSAALRLLPFFMIVVVTGASAQEDSVKRVDDIVNVFKLKKKGTLPFGFKQGATIEEIKAGMGGMEIFKEDSSYITYTIYFSSDKYDFGDVTFEFDRGMATDASIETYFGKKDHASKALNLLKLNFDKLYKSGEYGDKTLKWKYSKKGINLWIQLTEIEFEGDNGFVIDFLSAEPDDKAEPDNQ